MMCLRKIIIPWFKSGNLVRKVEGRGALSVETVCVEQACWFSYS